MRIAIISLPLSYNYGGYLQCYALMETLREMGHQVYFLQRENTPTPSVVKTLLDGIKRIMEMCGLKCLVYAFEKKTNSGLFYKTRNFREFTRLYIKTCSPVLRTTEQVRDFCKSHHINAYITGSDQIWRGKYSRSVNDSFLGFASRTALKIAYAPSFGSDKWEYNAEQTDFINNQLKTFSAISVREASGIKLLQDNVCLSCTPKLVLDPTFLLNKEHYEKIAQCEARRYGVLTYILNNDAIKQNMITSFCTDLNLQSYSVINPNTNSTTVRGGQGYKVEQWIAGFRDASYVITDSFHATVFSIIFNKPFWVFENESRGNSRLLNILQMFGCEGRLVSFDMNLESVDWTTPVDWERVNKKKDCLIKESLSFLRKALAYDKH